MKGYKIGVHKSRSGGLTKKGIEKYKRESFADKTSSHYSCMEKEDLIQQNNKVIKNA